MKVGFTGTRFGMNSIQKRAFEILILQIQPYEFHHGDCKGADFEAQLIVKHIRQHRLMGIKIIIHPPENDRLREFCEGDEIRPPLPYHMRNTNIATETDRLIAAPRESKEQKRGGTWFTVRYSRKLEREVIILWP